MFLTFSCRLLIQVQAQDSDIKDAKDMIINTKYFTVQNAAIRIMHMDNASSFGVNARYTILSFIPIVENPVLAGDINEVSHDLVRIIQYFTQ